MKEFILTIISVVLGFLLGQSADLFKNIRQSREKKKATQTLIELEIEKNRNLLKDYWKSVSESEEIWYNEENEFNYIKLAYSINDIVFPRLSRIVIDNNINFISSIYKSEEIKNIWNTYESYELLIDLKEHLLFKENESESIGVRAENRMRSGGSGGMVTNLVKSLNFNDDAVKVSKKFKVIIENIIGTEIKFINQKKA